MYVIIENIALAFLMFLGLSYVNFSPRLLMKKLLVFVLTVSASFVIQIVTHLITKTVISINNILLYSLQTGVIATLGYSLMIDMSNENIISLRGITDISTNKFAVVAAIVGSNVIANLISILIKTNYQSIVLA